MSNEFTNPYSPLFDVNGPEIKSRIPFVIFQRTEKRICQKLVLQTITKMILIF